MKNPYEVLGVSPGASEEEINACYDIDYELITREDPSIMNAVIMFMKKCIER